MAATQFVHFMQTIEIDGTSETELTNETAEAIANELEDLLARKGFTICVSEFELEEA